MSSCNNLPINQNNNVSYEPKQLEIGTQNNSLNTYCLQKENEVLETYIAESLNISGAPINVFKYMGIYEQSNVSLLPKGSLLSSTPLTNYNIQTINQNGWKSIETGSTIQNTSYIGINFGNLNGYSPLKPKMEKVGSIIFNQSSNYGEYCKQIRVDYTTGELCIDSSNRNFNSTSNSSISIYDIGINPSRGVLSIECVGEETYLVKFIKSIDSSIVNIGFAYSNEIFENIYCKFKINEGNILSEIGDSFNIKIDYVWKRYNIYNVIQSSEDQIINLQRQLLCNGIRIVPVLFTGNSNWVVNKIDFKDNVPTDINNIQDDFFNENRDRKYSQEGIELKVHYAPGESPSDILKFGGVTFSDQYSFTISFAEMVYKLKRPLIIGDIIELVPEMRYDQNLKPVKKFLEIKDTGWANEGFSPTWKPLLFKFSAEKAIASQETRDIFGDRETNQFKIGDSIFDTSKMFDPTIIKSEQTNLQYKQNVPEEGDNSRQNGYEVLKKPATIRKNKDEYQHITPPEKELVYIKDGLPKRGETYKEGYSLPPKESAIDKEYFRLYRPLDQNLPPSLYRYSLLKNTWIFIENDERDGSSLFKPDVDKAVKSKNKKSLKE